MATVAVSDRPIREVAPAIRNFCLLFAAASGFAETVAAVTAKRLDSEPLLAIQVALMFFTMCAISMALVAWSIAVRRAAVRVLLVAAAALPPWFVVYSLLQLAP